MPISLIAYLRDQDAHTLRELADGMTLTTPLPANHTIEVKVCGGKVGCVKMTLNTSSSIERIAPYRFGGDDADLNLTAGDYLFAASGYANRDGKGLPDVTLKLRFHVANPPPERVITKGLVSGLSSLPLEKADELHAIGITSLRNWVDIDWRSLPKATDADAAMDWKNRGFAIVTCFTTSIKPANAGVVRDWFSRAADVYRPAVTIFEIMNEPDLRKYWSGSLAEYVDLVLTPASAALKGKVKVCGAAVSEGVDEFRTLVNAGYLDLVDYAAFHPYGPDALSHAGRIKEVAGLCGDKPLLLTEWNIHAASPNKWVSNIDACWKAAKEFAAGAWYYRSIANAQPAGKQGIYTQQLAKNQPYFDGVARLK